MTKKEVVINSRADEFNAGLNRILISSVINNTKITKEERQKRQKQREVWEKKRKLKGLIVKNICPSCSGKLNRGKKDKKYDYKRLWSCMSCGNRFNDRGEKHSRGEKR